jgi:hypothetical protein
MLRFHLAVHRVNAINLDVVVMRPICFELMQSNDDYFCCTGYCELNGRGKGFAWANARNARTSIKAGTRKTVARAKAKQRPPFPSHPMPSFSSP